MDNITKPTLAVVMAITLLGLLLTVPYIAMAGTVTDGKVEYFGKSRGLAAVDASSRNGKYLFIFFWKENDNQSQAMLGVLETAMKKWSGSADSVSISIADLNEKPIVDKYGVSRAPMPLVLAIAPNGAVTKALPVKFDEKQLAEGFVSPATAKCLKCMQDRKLALLCIQNRKTQFSQAAWNGVIDFKADKRFAKATEVITVDPEDKAETTLLEALKVDPRTPKAVTVVLAPPGQPVATFVGLVTKDQIVSKITSAKSGPCAGGKCGPGGCCPPKK
jgi:hypothetical protein